MLFRSDRKYGFLIIDKEEYLKDNLNYYIAYDIWGFGSLYYDENMTMPAKGDWRPFEWN